MANLPLNLNFAIDAPAPALDDVLSYRPKVTGRLVTTWKAPTSDFVSVEIFRNGVSQVAGYTETSWTDTQWHEDNTYRLEVTGDTDTATTEVLHFPYYPSESHQGAHYHNQPWQLSVDTLAQGVLGGSNPLTLLKLKIRHEIELQRLDGGILTDIGHTVAGPLGSRDVLIPLFPAVGINLQSVPIATRTAGDNELPIGVTLEVFSEAVDLFDALHKVENITFWLAWLASQHYQWDGAVGAYDTSQIRMNYANVADPTRQDRFSVRQSVSFTVLTRLPFRE